MNAIENLVYEEDESVKAIVAADITFYITTYKGAEEGLIRAYHLAMEQLAPHVTWYRTEKMKRPKKIRDSVFDAFPFWFTSQTSVREEYGLTLTSGHSPDDVGPWGFEFWLVPSTLKTEAGFFQLNLPAEILQKDPKRFVDIVKSIAEELVFRSGHAGYGIQYDDGDIIDERDLMQRAWCNRYLGIDCRDLAITTEYVHDKIKGVNWLTLLDYEFCNRLKGVESIRKKLSSDVSTITLKNGLLIQAGTNPKLGDVNRNENMKAYMEVNKILKPLRLTDGLTLPGFDEDETIEWLGRFDT